MITSLLRAITPAQYWVGHFTRYEYREAFKDYTRRYEPLYLAAFAQVGDMDRLADMLLDGLCAHWKALPFWKRTAARVDEKTVVVTYLTPMLLASADPCGPQLADLLRRHWSARWPKDAYDTAPYEELLDGFRHSIMGFDLDGKHYRKKET